MQGYHKPHTENASLRNSKSKSYNVPLRRARDARWIFPYDFKWLFTFCKIGMLIISIRWIVEILRRERHNMETRMYKVNRSAACDTEAYYSHCRFRKSVCFDFPDRTWFTASIPYQGWTNVSRNVLNMGRKPFDSCDSPFVPQLIDPSNSSSLLDQAIEDGLLLAGKTIYVCMWIMHFGHALMDMLYPSFELLKTFGYDNVTILVDYDPKMVGGANISNVQLLSLLGNVIHLEQLKSSQPACFQDFLVGMKQHGIYGNKDHFGEGYTEFRDYVFSRNGISVSQVACKISVVSRENDRRLINEEALLFSLEKQFSSDCTIKKLIFEHMALIDQIKEISDTTIMISVAGTGSHHAIWLPDNGTDILLLHPGNINVNLKICQHSKHKCFRSQTYLEDGPVNPNSQVEFEDQKAADVFCNVQDIIAKINISRNRHLKS